MSRQERYELTWPGKREAIIEAGRPTDKTLRPCVELSRNFDTTENLYIEGDNLEALKILQKSYMKRVKMIYIDPPYNTGNDFIYRDDFSQSEFESQQQCMIDESGMRNFSFRNYRENAKSNPRFHSDWLSMIYSRLKLARNLLTDDGVIFISIDDNEQAGLKFVCNEIFGENNFVAQLVWERAYAPKNDAKYVSMSHDYILMYAINIQAFKIGRLPRTEEANARYNNPDNDPRGPWKPSDLSVKTYNAANDYPITTPSGRIVEPPTARCWSLSPNSFADRLADNRIWFGPNGDGVPRLKRFLSELRHEGMVPVSILYYKDVGHSQEGAQEVAKLLDGGFFNGPKPVRLLRHLMTLANLDDDSIILDFFAGSSTTAHAVMTLNSQDGGTRKFIMIQIPEPCKESSEAFKAGYSNICEIGRERILRAGNGLIGDTGFRTFRVDSTNYKNVYFTPEELTQDMLDNLVENIKPDRTGLDLLYGVIAELGLPLSLKYSCEQVEGFTVHYYGEDKIIACFDSGIDESLVKFIAKKRPAIALFRDSCFEDSNVMINLEQFFRFYAPDSEIKIL